MKSSTRNTEPAESAKALGNESEDLENRSNRLAADKAAEAAVQGLTRLSRQKTRKAPPQAA
jgi:hypothetical protein